MMIDNKKICIILIIILSTNTVTGFSSQDVEWGADISKTLYKGDTLSNGEYTIKIIDFASPVPGVKIIDNNQKKIVPETKVEPAVHLEIYKNDIFIKDIILNIYSSSYIDPDYEFKISATDFLLGTAKEWVMEYYNPWVKISLQKRGKPGFEATFKFIPEKRDNIVYNGDSFTLSVTLKNSGEAMAKNVDVNLNIGPLRLLSDKSQLHQSYYVIEKGVSKSFCVTFAVPEMLDEQIFNLSLNEKFFDIKDIEYNNINSTQITTSPRLINISKSMKDRIYLKDRIMVRIVVMNTGNFDIYNIHVDDNLNGIFELKSETPLQWDISLLRPGQDWTTSYYVKPLETNIDGLDMPLANVSFIFNNRQYNVSSQPNKIIVNGPKIILNKTVDKNMVKIGEFVAVNVTIKNAGNIGTRIEVKDTLPEDVSLREGVLSLYDWSDPNTVQGFGYIIRMNKEGTFKLPAVISNYTDVEYKGTIRGVISSDRPIITVLDPNKAIPVPSETPMPEATIVVPGFEGIFGIVGILFTTIIRRRRRTKKYKNG